MSSASSSSSSSSSRESTPEITEPKELKRKRTPKTKTTSDDSDSDSSDDEQELSESGEPVLSHKERRRQKKEAKLAAKLAEEGKTLKKRKLKDGTAKEVTNTARKNSVWVGNMSFKTDQDDIRRFFKDVGEITRINLPTKAPTGPGVKPQNRGFAYVDFTTPEAKAAAIALSEQPLVGRKLLIKDGDDFTGRPAAIAGEVQFSDPTLAHKTHSKTAQKILRAQKQPPAPTLFFGNLGFDTTDDSLRQLLEAHRAPQPKKKTEQETNEEETEKEAKPKQETNWIRKIRLGTFEDTGVCKGFGFVDFTSVEHATSVLINTRNHHLNGRKLVVEYAGAEAVRRGAPKSARPLLEKARTDRFKSDRGPRENFGPRRPQYAPDQEHAEESEPVVAAEEQEEKPAWSQKERPLKPDGQGGFRHKGPKHRPKPGAALALAKRESAAIIPSQGKKITF